MRSLLVCSLFLALALSACASPPRALRWEAVGGEPRRADVASWRAFIAPGACAWTNRSMSAGIDSGVLDAGALDAGTPAYDRTASSLDMLAAPPELDPGRWSFHLIGSNAEGRALTAGCTTETLPLPRDARVTVRLEPAFLAPGGDFTSIRFCTAWSELGCRDGDDDCDGVSDCLDACADGSVCECGPDVSCGDCRTCDLESGLCRTLPDGEACAASGGSCISGSCCTGCTAGDRCREGTATLACGSGGELCEACPCGCDGGSCVDCVCGALVTDPGRSITVGRRFACVRDRQGVRCAGAGTEGQLGTGSTTDGLGWALCPGTSARCSADSETQWSTVRAGGAHACAVRAASDVQPRRLACWGENHAGQLGRGDSMRVPSPGWVGNSGGVFGVSDVLAFDLGSDFTCALASPVGALDAGLADAAQPDAGGLTPGRPVWCWGNSAKGRLGVGPREMVAPQPLLVRGAPPAESIALGGAHACALTGAGALYCWGDNEFDQVDQSLVMDFFPSPVSVRSMERWLAIDLGEAHTCGVRQETDGYHVECWGRDDAGQVLALGPLDGDLPRLALGDRHTCVLAEGVLRCAGDGAAFGMTGAVRTPTMVPLPDGTITAIAAGGDATCVVVDVAGASQFLCAGDVACGAGAGCPFRAVCLPADGPSM